MQEVAREGIFRWIAGWRGISKPFGLCQIGGGGQSQNPALCKRFVFYGMQGWRHEWKSGHALSIQWVEDSPRAGL